MEQADFERRIVEIRDALISRLAEQNAIIASDEASSFDDGLRLAYDEAVTMLSDAIEVRGLNAPSTPSGQSAQSSDSEATR